MYQEVPKGRGRARTTALRVGSLQTGTQGYREGPRERAELSLCFPWGWSFQVTCLHSACIYDSRSQVRSCTKSHPMNRESPKLVCKENSEAEAIPDRQSPGPESSRLSSPRGGCGELGSETLSIQIQGEPPGGAAGSKVPGAHRLLPKCPRPTPLGLALC